MKITFGKYKGSEVNDIIQIDPSYLLWANNNVSFFKLTEEQIKLCRDRCPKRYYSPFDEEEERYELYGEVSVYDEAFGIYD